MRNLVALRMDRLGMHQSEGRPRENSADSSHGQYLLTSIERDHMARRIRPRDRDDAPVPEKTCSRKQRTLRAAST
jgi:hypothetical protein